MTLVELLVGLVVASIVGTALVQGIVTESRMMEDREAWRTARQVSRTASNVLANELRMVESGGGIETAAANGLNFIARVPYALGVLCSTNGTTSTLALMPADSVMFAGPGFAGFAWRAQATGAYTYVTSGTSLNTSGSSAACTSAGITPVPAIGGSPAGRVVTVTGTVPNTLPAGTPFLLFRRIQYEFKASAMVPGRTGLWRTILGTGIADELAAPFDPASRFRYYVQGSATPQEGTPNPLSAMRGIQVQADGRSEAAPRLAPGGPRVVRLPTAVYFFNVSP